jgi:hypothetical protein
MWFLDNINTMFDWWPFAAIKHKDGDDRKLQEMSYFVEKAAQFGILSGLRMPNCSVACSLCMPDPYTARVQVYDYNLITRRYLPCINANDGEVSPMFV